MSDLSNGRGSNWLKCDLHVHTPASFFHQYGDSQSDTVWDKFIDDLEALSAEFKVIGINDYLTLEGYKKVLTYLNKGRLQNLECILPVIEFRIDKFAGNEKLRRINYHVIFSNEINPETIQSQFLNALAAKYTLESGSSEPDWSAALTNESLIDLGQRLKKKSPSNSTLQSESDWRVGFNNFNVNYEHLKEVLKRTAFQNRIITAIGKGEWDDYRWNSAADKRTIINEADLVFLACENPTHYNNAKEKLNQEQVNNKLLDCSDAHHYSDTAQKDRIGNCHTWLKIEPTFNGLKQILFMPDDRICVSESHPDQKAPYQVIDRIQFVNGGKLFTDQTIKLSSSLNSIIGGKSTGKSLLAGLIVKSSDPAEYALRKEDRKNQLDWIPKDQTGIDFQVHWKDGAISRLNSNDTSRKITYFPQHYLNSKINDTGAGNKELNKSIRSILSQTEAYSDAFDEYAQALQTTDQKVAADASGLETKLRELSDKKKTLQEKGKSADIKKNIEQLKQELSALKSQYDLSEDELKKHNEISNTVKELKEKEQIISEDVAVLSEIDENQIVQSLDISILLDQYDALSDEVRSNLQKKISPHEKAYAGHILSAVKTLLSEQQKQDDSIKGKIKTQETEHAPIIEKIRNSAPLREKTKLIQQETTKLDEVVKLEMQIQNLTVELDAICDRLIGYVNEKITHTDIVKGKISEHPFTSEDSTLGIVIAHRCKAEHIQSLLKDRVKYLSNPTIKAFINDEEFNDTNIDGYVKRLKNLLDQAKKGVLEFKGEYKISGVVQEILSNALYLNYDLQLEGDSFNIMSPGKRALALLRVLVELDQSQHPIVLDQPEDDLDNRSIYEGLAEYLRKKKKDRQIIVVTHNPNVVVGADSEHVIVANQSGKQTNQNNRKFRFEYVYGGLENSFAEEGNNFVLEKQGIREHVCEILDGGEDAFKRREKLYSGFKRVTRQASTEEKAAA